MIAEQELKQIQAAHPHVVEQIYVWEAPVRLWHWGNFLSMLVLMVTGYLIGSPPPSIGGEASDHFMFGWIRLLHFSAAYVFAIGLLVRLYWAFVGNSHAKQIFMLPLTDKQWWKDLWGGLKWYMFANDRPRYFVGHNPQAQLVTVLGYTVPAFLMVFSGFALYSEGKGVGTWTDLLFGWIIPLVGGSQALHTLHHLGLWVLVLFAMAHIYAVIRDDIMSRQSQVSSIISGYRINKDRP